MEERFLRMVSNEVQYKRLIGENPYAINDIKWPVLRQRLLDNIEDSIQKRNGKLKGQSKLRGKDAPREERKTVVVLGTGWASHAFVKLASTYDLRVVVVSPVNHFVFTPMLASAAVGTVEYRSMTESIRVTNPYIDNFVEGRAIGIDVRQKKLQVQLTSLSTVTGRFKGLASEASCRLEGEPVLTNIAYSDDGSTIVRDVRRQGASDVIELNYDTLICAVGTASRSAMVAGAKEHCFNLKTSQDSKRLRTAIGEALEYASRPDVQEFYYDGEEEKVRAKEERRRRVRIAVVGGGPTGVELCGELQDFFAQVCAVPDGAYQHLKDDISVMLIHGGSDLLPAMDKDLRVRALESLQSQGVQIRLNTRLKEVGRDYITIFEKGNADAEETIPVGITVWAAGNAPVPFVKELLSQLPPEAAGSAGRVNVDSWLRCPTPTEDTFGSILVLGDVACFEAEKEKYDDAPQILPQTAQVAGQQGAFAARMMNRGYDLQRTPPKLPESSEASLLRTWLVARGLEEATGYNFLSLGLLAYIGQEEALNQVAIGNVPLFNYSGKIAFALWRSVYLTKQASTRNQALIAFDWLRTTAFGRDITRL
jgi:NADH dehydrogenase FAD-containing subunit